MDFHGLLSELLEWLNETEEKVSALAPLSSASPADIQNEARWLFIRNFLLFFIHCTIIKIECVAYRTFICAVD